MRRRTTLGFLGVLLAGGAGYLALEDGPGQVGPGRYRDGRGRVAREGPPRGGSSCISASGTATNYALWSQAFDNAVWSSFADVTAPTVTANAAVAAPSCATTFNIAGCGQTGVVDRVQFPATGIGHFSGIRQSPVSTPEQDNDAFVYAIAGPGGCPDGLDIGTSDATSYYFTTTPVGSSWVRISDLGGGTSVNTVLYIGNLSPVARPTDALGAVARQACDVYLFQADDHSAGSETRPVKTTTASASQGPGCY